MQEVSEKRQESVSETRRIIDAWKRDGEVTEGKREYRSKRLTGSNLDIFEKWIRGWARNAAINYPVVREGAGVDFLKGAAKGLPAVCVGIGPSLDRDVARIKELAPYALILASDAAVAPLLANGVKPDIVLNFDARDKQRTMWDTLDTSNLVLLANSCTSPLTIDAWKGPAMFFNMGQGEDEFCSNILPIIYPYIGSLPNLGTVGNGAVFLAYHMGCSKIYLFGFDFCYSEKDGKPDRYRCTDYKWLAATEEFPTGRFEPRDNDVLYKNAARLEGVIEEMVGGQRVFSDECLTNYRKILLELVGMLDLPVVDCSGGSMTGMLCSKNFDQVKAELPNRIWPGETIVRHLARIVPHPTSAWKFSMAEGIWERRPC